MTDALAAPDAVDPIDGDDREREPGWLRARLQRDESGLALVWMTVFLMVILGFAAVALDIGRGYAVAQDMQNAADSSSLAGTIFLPTDVPTSYSTARTVATQNGYTTGVDNVTVTPAQQTTVSRLKVTIKKTVNTWFARAIGWKSITITRSSTADYRPPVNMGSPSAQYGNDPESSGTFGSTTYPNFWGNISGPASPKGNGDAYQGGGCDSSDGCDDPPSDVSCGYTGTNTDYSCDGYNYTVNVPAATSTLKLQAFDAGFVTVGDSCGSNDDASNLSGAATLTSTQVKGWPAGVTFNASTRYKPVSDPSNVSDAGQRYCNGDHSFDGNVSYVTTTYTVYGPALVPNDPSSAPATPVCTKSYPGFLGDLQAGLQSSTKQAVTVNGASSPEYLAQYFRQWDNLCSSTINAAANSQYFINVRTNLTTTGQPNSAGSGANRFGLRACSGSTCPTTNGAAIYGNGNMGVYANVGGGQSTNFYLARLLPGDAGHTLSVSLFDIGDGSSSGTLTIVPPTDGKNGTSTLTLSGCTMQIGVGNSFTATNGSNCSITGVTSGSYNGKWLTINVPLPSGYTCTLASATGCWFKINYQFSGYIDDSTSWTASLGGDPVRIVQ